MPQDIILGIDSVPEEFRDIYLQPTPVCTEYPGGVVVGWAEFERLLKSRAREAGELLGAEHEFESILMWCYGEVPFQLSDVELDFRVFGLSEKAHLPGSKNVDDKPDGYVEILTSKRYDGWSEFVALLRSAERGPVPTTELWHERMEDQLLVCGLRALRRVFPRLEERVYAGFAGYTSEMVQNLSSALPLRT